MLAVAGGILLAVLLIATIEWWIPMLWWFIKAGIVVAFFALIMGLLILISGSMS